jgi:hypothetical protein
MIGSMSRLAVLRGCFWEARTKQASSTKDSVFQFSNLSLIVFACHLLHPAMHTSLSVHMSISQNQR